VEHLLFSRSARRNVVISRVRKCSNDDQLQTATGGGRRFRMGGQNHRVSGDGSPSAGCRGGAPVGGLGDEVPQKLKNFKSSYKQILRIFW